MLFSLQVLCVVFLTASSDYSAVWQEVVFPAGTTQRSMAIPIMEDSVLEATESFYVMVTTPVSHTEVVMLDTNVATINITDDDCKWLHVGVQIAVASD